MNSGLPQEKRSLGNANEGKDSHLKEPDITDLLVRWKGGDSQAFSRLIDLVYDRLRLLAAQALRKNWVNQSLQPTELVHEVYLKLASATPPNWKDRGHFFRLAARMMRQILVDRARAKAAQKRDANRVPIEPERLAAAEASDNLVSIDEALEELGQVDPDQEQLVELRFFLGLTIEETAEVLGVSSGTISRNWRLAKAWLKRRLTSSDR
jgi:RNA polymerase sigma factor (TIGR02999 family)